LLTALSLPKGKRRSRDIRRLSRSPADEGREDGKKE
jgi:hypothetical protein